ncbi:HlyD family type I secretion periplasmic adaptor subunit [Methylobacterium sp. P31]
MHLTARDEPAVEIGHGHYAGLGFGAIVLVFGALGIWSAVAPLDQAAIAQGQIAVQGSHKAVQHLEGGIVREILVHETQAVRQGDVLFRLQPTQALAGADTLRKQVDVALATEARLVAEQSHAAAITFPPGLVARLSVPETATAVLDQERQFAERRRSLDTQVGILNSGMEEKTQEIEGRTQQRATLTSQLASYAQEIGSLSELAAKGYYPRNKLLGLQRERDRIRGELAMADSSVARLRKSIDESRLQIQGVHQKQDTEVAQQLAEIRGRLSELREKAVIAEDVLTRIEVRAQRDGIVYDLKVHTVGAVVKPGETLAEIVPVGDGLVVEAKVSPLDIESVAVGQKAEVRFQNFSSRETPIILGRVKSVSPDSLVDEGTHQTYFSAQVVIDEGTIAPGVAKRIIPGMTADVLITTGERTVLQYLAGPLFNSLAKAFREK